MAIELKLKQVTEQDGGGYAVAVEALRLGTTEVLARKTYSLPAGSTKDDLKNAIRPAFTDLKAEEDRRDLLRTVAAAALTELMEE